MVALGILAATGLSLWLARRNGVATEFVMDAVFWAVVAGFLGARFLYLLVSWQATLADPVGAVFSGGGGVIAGGLVAGAAAVAWTARRHRVSPGRAADLLVPGVALAQALGRVGCHLAGCCFGCVAPAWAAPFSVRFPRLGPADATAVTGSWPYLDHLRRGLVTTAEAWSLPVVPVQLLEAAWCGFLAFGLTALWFRRLPAGTVAVAYGVSYAVGRFALEYLRGDEDRGVRWGLSLSQWLALIALAALAWLWLTRIRPRAAYQPPSASA